MCLFIRCSSCGLVTTLRFFCLPLPSLFSAFLFFFSLPSSQPCCFQRLRACNSFAVPSVYSLHYSKKQQNSKVNGNKGAVRARRANQNERLALPLFALDGGRIARVDEDEDQAAIQGQLLFAGAAAGTVAQTSVSWPRTGPSGAAAPFEERAPANSRFSLPKTQSPAICNKCAPLKQDHMDNKLAINTASAHPLNLAQISNFQSN